MALQNPYFQWDDESVFELLISVADKKSLINEQKCKQSEQGGEIHKTSEHFFIQHYDSKHLVHCDEDFPMNCLLSIRDNYWPIRLWSG